MRLAALLIAIFLSAFLVAGAYQAWSQHRRLNTYEPVPCTILAKRIKTYRSNSSRGGSQTTYSPRIKYSYMVAGKQYENDQVTITHVTSNSRWARSVLDRYRVGQTAEAYHDPKDPSKAFLLREVMFFPYLLLLMPTIFGCIAFGILLQQRDRFVLERPSRYRTGSSILSPETTIVDKRKTWFAFTAALWGVGFVAFGHYLCVTGFAMDSVSITTALVYFGLGLFPLGWFLYWNRLERSLGDAVVVIDQPAYRPGETLHIEVSQPVRAGLTVSRVELTLIAERTDSIDNRARTETIYETECLPEGRPVRLESAVSSRMHVTLPEDATPTTKGRRLPQIQWSLKLYAEVADGPGFGTKFPLFVNEARVEHSGVLTPAR